MKRHNLFVRIVAILLCAIMVLGVVTAAISAFAADVNVPETGSTDMTFVIIAAVLAVAVIVGCIVLPKFIKKK